MHVGVIGTGYVGLVAGACLAETGNDVLCVDIDEQKVRNLEKGILPIYEPGLESLVLTNAEQHRLRFTTDLALAVRESDVIFVAVGTPDSGDGTPDMSQVLSVARAIGVNLNGEKVVVMKSTVPVGTNALVKRTIEALTDHPVHICSNPEFLKEGAAVNDFRKPDRVVIGVESEFARELMEELYEPFVRNGNPILVMDPLSAEITKYAANAMLATRISFMNTVARLSEAVGADVDHIRIGLATDPRIGAGFLFPGVGYGGSCFPKDVKALIHTLQDQGVDASILAAVDEVNEGQKSLLLERIVERYGEDLTGRRFGVWGLSFKPGTDDMREAPSVVVIEGLLARGATVAAHDPVALEEARRRFGDRVEWFEHNYDALEGADALVIHTEWDPYRRPDFGRIRALLNQPVVFDGRNLYRPERMARHGFEYHSIGRAAVRQPVAESEPSTASPVEV